MSDTPEPTEPPKADLFGFSADPDEFNKRASCTCGAFEPGRDGFHLLDCAAFDRVALTQVCTCGAATYGSDQHLASCARVAATYRDPITGDTVTSTQGLSIKATSRRALKQIDDAIKAANPNQFHYSTTPLYPTSQPQPPKPAQAPPSQPAPKRNKFEVNLTKSLQAPPSQAAPPTLTPPPPMQSNCGPWARTSVPPGRRTFRLTKYDSKADTHEEMRPWSDNNPDRLSGELKMAYHLIALLVEKLPWNGTKLTPQDVRRMVGKEPMFTNLIMSFTKDENAADVIGLAVEFHPGDPDPDITSRP